MTFTKCVCPSCSVPLKSSRVLPDRIKCPRCSTMFSPSAAAAEVVRAVPTEAVRSGNRRLLLVLGGVSFLTLLLVAVVLAVAFLPGSPANSTETAVAERDPPAVEENPEPRFIEDMPEPAESGPGLAVPEGAAWAASLTPEQQKQVDQAIDKGVGFLKRTVTEAAATNHPRRTGGAALIGLTMLACGLPADDPALKKVLSRVRSEGAATTGTYDLALCILCLDQLGGQNDDSLIQEMAARLLAGQKAHGWTYACPKLSAADRTVLFEELAALQVGDGRVTPAGVGRTDPPGARRAAGDKKRGKGQKPGSRMQTLPILQEKPTGSGDNSNTQFALLAVWVARKHGVPVDRSLALVEKHFRESQNADGSWGYHAGTRTRPDSMTCAGLLGLAAGMGLVRGEAAKKAAGQKDSAIGKGFDFLARSVGSTNKRGSRGKVIGAQSLGDLYYLWSLERVAVLYDQRTIRGKEWYPWGANILVKNQKADGSWHDTFPGTPDTCFALLFLKKTNVAGDLTEQLRSLNLLQRVEK